MTFPTILVFYMTISVLILRKFITASYHKCINQNLCFGTYISMDILCFQNLPFWFRLWIGQRCSVVLLTWQRVYDHQQISVNFLVSPYSFLFFCNHTTREAQNKMQYWQTDKGRAGFERMIEISHCVFQLSRETGRLNYVLSSKTIA